MASPTIGTGIGVPPSLIRATRRQLPPDSRTNRWSRWGRALRGTGGLRILTAAAGGFATELAFAPSTAWWAALLGLAALGCAVHGRRAAPAAGLGLVFGLAFYLPLLSWTTVYVGAVAVALGIAEALLTAPAVMLIAVASRRLPAWPFLAAGCWTAGETLRAHFPFGGFPWGGIAFSQADGPLLPTASLVGAAGLAFATALAGFGLAALIRTARMRFQVDSRSRAAGTDTRTRQTATVERWSVWVAPAVALLLPVALGLAGRATVQMGTSDTDHAVIAIIQGNVPEPGLEFNARRRAVLDLHAKQTHQLAADVRAGRAPRPEFVLWPENSSDIDPYSNGDAAAVISSAARDVGVPIVVGAVVDARRNSTAGSGPAAADAAPGSAGTLNMGIVWDPVSGPGQTYTKRHPVPFAEYMPWRGFFRTFSHWVDRAGNFLPGDVAGNLLVAGRNVGDVICFEVVYDDLVRDVVTGGAQVLVVQTNNATFGYTAETYQQQAMSRVRAVEHGRAVLIAATSGVSAVIGPDGAVEGSIPLFTPGYLTPSVPLISARTPGSLIGPAVEWTVTIGTLLAIIAGALIARRRARAGESTGLAVPAVPAVSALPGAGIGKNPKP